MLKNLAKKMGIPYGKMPNNGVEKYGNSSGVTIPVVLTLNFRDALLKESIMVCFAGFGVGLNWGGIVMNIGKLDFCEMLEYNEL